MKTYFPWQIERMSNAELRKEYSRLRSIANKRVIRLREQELGRYVTKFPTLAEIQSSNKVSVSSQLAEVSSFLRSERTTVSGEKRFLNDFAEKMRHDGYGDLVKSIEDIYNLIDFMEDMRETYSDKVFDSGDALDVLQQAQRLNIPYDKIAENYVAFATHLKELEKVKPSKSGRAFSQKRIDNLINKWSDD